MKNVEELRTETITLLSALYDALETATEGEKSTDDINSQRLLWEFINKIFTIIVSTENGIKLKDSLSIQLVGRYTYETLVSFLYIYLESAYTEERARAFLNYDPHADPRKKYFDNKNFADMLRALLDKSWSEMHSSHYRELSSLAHPTMRSFLINRKGQETEFRILINTALLIIGAIREILSLCIQKGLFFPLQTVATLSAELERITTAAVALMESNMSEPPKFDAEASAR